MVNIWEPQRDHVISKYVLKEIHYKGTALDVSFLEEPGGLDSKLGLIRLCGYVD